MENNMDTHTQHDALLQMFSYEFYTISRQMEPKIQKKMVELASVIFQKWYVSALIQETMLSPANIITASIDKKKKKTSVYAYTLSINERKRGEAKYSYVLKEYSTKEHPIIEDLKLVLSHCIPDINIGEECFFSEEVQAELLSALSQPDLFYLEYLICLAWECDLLEKLPSIYSRRVQAANIDVFFARPVSEILKDLVYGAMRILARQFEESICADWSFLTKDFLLTVLDGPQDVDRIFIRIYQKLGYDIEEIWSRSSADLLEPEDSPILSSFFFMGIILDKWFLTPLYAYFKVIQPLYFMPYHFVNSINHLAALLIGEGDVSLELYTPCSYYSITPLGRKLFEQSASKEEDRQVIPPQISFDQIMNALEREINLQLLAESMAIETYPKHVYSFKIRFQNDKRMWKVLEIPINATVDELCEEACLAFHFEDAQDYLLTVVDENEFPMTYSSKSSKRSLVKAEDTSLAELSLQIKDKLELMPNLDKQKLLELELQKVMDYNPYILYPRIKKQSTLITQIEKMESLS